MLQYPFSLTLPPNFYESLECPDPKTEVGGVAEYSVTKKPADGHMKSGAAYQRGEVAASKEAMEGVCQHQRRRSRCKECGGAGLCQHQRQRSACKECGGASICQHQRQRSQCKECGGASFCQRRHAFDGGILRVGRRGFKVWADGWA